MTIELNTILPLLRKLIRNIPKLNFLQCLVSLESVRISNLLLRANIFWQLIRYLLALYSANYRVLFVFTWVQLYSSSVLVFHSCSLVFYSCSLVFYSCSLVFTRVHQCSLVFRLVWSFRSDRIFCQLKRPIA